MNTPKGNNLEAQLGGLAGKIDGISERLVNVDQKLTTASIEAGHLSQEVKDVKSQTVSLGEETRDLQTKVASIEATVVEVNNNAKLVRSATPILMFSAIAAILTVMGLLVNTWMAIGATRETVGALNDAKGHQAAEIDKLTTITSKLTASTAALDDNNKALLASSKKVDEKLGTLETTITRKTQDWETAANTLINRTNTELKQVEDSIKKVAGANSDLENTLKEHAKTIAEFDRRLSEVVVAQQIPADELTMRWALKYDSVKDPDHEPNKVTFERSLAQPLAKDDVARTRASARIIEFIDLYPKPDPFSRARDESEWQLSCNLIEEGAACRLVLSSRDRTVITRAVEKPLLVEVVLRTARGKP